MLPLTSMAAAAWEGVACLQPANAGAGPWSEGVKSPRGLDGGGLPACLSRGFKYPSWDLVSRWNGSNKSMIIEQALSCVGGDEHATQEGRKDGSKGCA